MIFFPLSISEKRLKKDIISGRKSTKILIISMFEIYYFVSDGVSS